MIGPKHQVSNSKSFPKIQSPLTCRSTVHLISFRKLSLNPIHKHENPLGIVENRHKNPYRGRKPVTTSHSIHEDLARKKKNMLRSRTDSFFVSLYKALKDVCNGENNAYEAAKELAEPHQIAFGVEHRRVLRRIREPWKSEFREEEEVDDGEENKGQVLKANHATGGEDNHDHEGIELPKGYAIGFVDSFEVLALLGAEFEA